MQVEAILRALNEKRFVMGSPIERRGAEGPGAFEDSGTPRVHAPASAWIRCSRTHAQLEARVVQHRIGVGEIACRQLNCATTRSVGSGGIAEHDVRFRRGLGLAIDLPHVDAQAVAFAHAEYEFHSPLMHVRREP